MENYSTTWDGKNKYEFEDVFLVLDQKDISMSNFNGQNNEINGTCKKDIFGVWTVEARLECGYEPSIASQTDIENNLEYIKIIDTHNPFNNYLPIGCYCVELLKCIESEAEVKSYIENVFERNNIFISIVEGHPADVSKTIQINL